MEAQSVSLEVEILSLGEKDQILQESLWPMNLGGYLPAPSPTLPAPEGLPRSDFRS
jgi:hypothetical protein